MRYLSLCSGIEAASVAWAPMGWKAAAFAEIEAFPSAVLAHHYPDVPNLGDITKFKEWPDLGPVDIVCGGTPCQSFSVAGLRKGLADPRGNLSLTFLAIVDKYRPRYVVWENVPGVLSSDGGRDFAAFLGGLGQLGYGWAFRVLDAQFCRVDGFPRAVPQRRRRVFVVGYLGDWRRAAAVLSEPESVLGDTPPRREAGQGSADPTARSVAIRGREGTPQAELGEDVANAILTPNGGRAGVGVGAVLTAFGGNNCSGPIEAAASLAAHGGPAGRMDFASETFVCFDARQSDAIIYGDKAGPIDTDAYSQAIAFAQNQRDEVRVMDVAGALAAEPGMKQQTYVGQPIPIDMRQASRGATMTNNRPEGTSGGEPGTGIGEPGDPAPTVAGSHTPAVAFTCSDQANGFAWERDVWQTLDAQVPSDTSNIQKGIRQGWAVRRLTPTECERLQGFPDSYTAIPYRGKPAADGPRYKALGNSWACNVARWVGRRIEMVEQIAADLERERAA